jgi:hypothetical protein
MEALVQQAHLSHMSALTAGARMDDGFQPPSKKGHLDIRAVAFYKGVACGFLALRRPHLHRIPSPC